MLDKKSFKKSLSSVLVGSMLIVGFSTQAVATEQRKIATASTTGAFYPIGGVMASILSKNMEGYNFTAEATGGSVENARLVGSKESDIAFFGGDTLYHANHGTGKFKGRPPIKLAPIARIYGMPLQFVSLKEDGLNSLRDLENKAVAVGAPGSGTSSKAKIILEQSGLVFDQNVIPRFLNFREGADALVDNNVSALVLSVGLPSGNIQEIAATHAIKLLAVDEDVREKMARNTPFFERYVIPGGTYKGVDSDVNTVGTSTYIAVSPDMSVDEVYTICKVLFGDHLAEFKQAHAALSGADIKEFAETIVPLHPGAEKFYREVGVLSK